MKITKLTEVGGVMSVERFEPSGGGGQGAAYYEMDKASDGEWVRFEDYEKLHKELDTLSTRFTALMKQNNTLAAENERLSEKLAAMESHWAANNPGSADQYRAEAYAVREELGFSVESEEVSPADLVRAIQSIKADKPVVAVPDDVVSTLERVAGGLENQIGNAGLRNDLYDAGYLRAIKREVLRLRDALAAAPSHSQQSSNEDKPDAN